MGVARRSTPHIRRQKGFSLIEVFVAAMILTVGLLSVASVFSTSLALVKYSEEDSIARQEGQAMIESIFAARNSGAHPFSDFQSKAAPISLPAGIFQDGYQPALQPGPDGIMNTYDDGPIPNYEVGPDGKQLTNFQRMIQFNPVLLQDGVTIDPNTRQVQVSVQYRIGNLVRTYTQVTYISTYR